MTTDEDFQKNQKVIVEFFDADPTLNRIKSDPVAVIARLKELGQQESDKEKQSFIAAMIYMTTKRLARKLALKDEVVDKIIHSMLDFNDEDDDAEAAVG